MNTRSRWRAIRLASALLLAPLLSLTACNAPAPPAPQRVTRAITASLFEDTVAFATKTGYRGVVAWRASQVVAGVVHWGSSPELLTETTSPLPGAPDTAQMAVLPLGRDLVGNTIWYQVEDTLTGERTEIASFEAENAYTEWNGAVYTIDMLVQLDTNSLPADIPSDQALADIAAGMNVFAERLYDALDGYVRIGNVIVTDTILDYPVNVPAQGQVCADETRQTLADVLIQTTVPFDSHTWSGWAIDDPCVAFYVGRIGQLVVPWEDDLHFGYVSTHELMHYAFNAPDLYDTNSDVTGVGEPAVSCRNLEWDGSLMHNSGGWNGSRWELTELDRNPLLTPCHHGDEPYTWAVLRERYTRVPEAPFGPIDHVVDTKARGNADGGGLTIFILDREPGGSTLTRYTPEDVNDTCSAGGAQVVDAENDATGFIVVESTPLPSDSSLDILEERMTWDGDAEALTVSVLVKDLEGGPSYNTTGQYFRIAFTYAGAGYTLIVQRDPLGPLFFLENADGDVIIEDLPGELDPVTDELRVVLTADAFAAAVPGAARMAPGGQIDPGTILAQRLIGVLTPTADTARSACTYYIDQEDQGPNQAPVAGDDTGSVDEDGTTTIDVLANDHDPEGSAIVVEGVTQGSLGRAALDENGKLTYTPFPDANGAETLSYTVRDTVGATATAQVAVTVRPVPDAPVAGNDVATTKSGEPVTIAVLANDRDADGDTLRVASFTQGASGAVTSDGTTVTYTPGRLFGPDDRFSYTVSDGTGRSATATVTVIRDCAVPGRLDDLEPAPDAGWTVENSGGTALSWRVIADPLAHSPVQSFFSDSTDASADKDDRLIWAPFGALPGTKLIFWHRYVTEDGFDGGVLEVSIDGGPFVDVQAAGGVFVEGGYVKVADALGNRRAWTGVSGLSMSRVEVDLSALAAHTVRPRWRLVSDANLGLPGWWIDDVQTVHVNDPTSPACQVATNGTPDARDDEALTQRDAPVTIEVLANDSDPDGDALVITSAGGAAHGTVSTDGSRVTYTPAAGFNGADTFTYTIDDGNDARDTATVHVSVNAPPSAADDVAATSEDKATTIAVLANDSDADSDTLTITEVSAPSHGQATVNADGTIAYAPAAEYAGSDTFTYTLSDGRGGTATATVTVTIDAVNDSPVAVDDEATTAAHREVLIDVLANDRDADGDALTIESISPAGHGTVSVRPDGRVRYRSKGQFTGTDTFTYRVVDGHGGESTGTVTVTVTGR